MQTLIKVGQVEPKSSAQVTDSKIGLGFEKLDRDAFHPEKAYDKVAETGAKWIRIQSGWAKTEREPGVYDWAWLDDVVDNLVRRGLRPWICLCYGNGLYDEQAAKVFGAVGCPPIHSQAARDAWDAYVTALVEHYIDRVSYYEIWNEPDGIWCWKHGVSAEEYGDFAVATCRAIRRGSERAKIIGMAYCMPSLAYVNTALSRGMTDYIQAVSFHEYTPDERRLFDRVNSLRALVQSYNPEIEVVQGESGCQSKPGGAGALNGGGWDERKQTKQLLRHTIADLMCDVMFTSYFSCLDMFEGLNGLVDNKASYLDYAYFGVLGADFDDNGVATGEYYRKPSFYALQCLCSIFEGDYSTKTMPVRFEPEHSDWIFKDDCSDPTIQKGGFVRPDGSSAFVYWNSLDLMTTDFESTITIEATRQQQQIRLIDPYDGSVYEIPEAQITRSGDGTVLLRHIPIRDYPLILTFGDFAR